jgi:hypothetical protein
VEGESEKHVKKLADQLAGIVKKTLGEP